MGKKSRKVKWRPVALENVFPDETFRGEHRRKTKANGRDEGAEFSHSKKKKMAPSTGTMLSPLPEDDNDVGGERTELYPHTETIQAMATYPAIAIVPHGFVLPPRLHLVPVQPPETITRMTPLVYVDPKIGYEQVVHPDGHMGPLPDVVAQDQSLTIPSEISDITPMPIQCMMGYVYPGPVWDSTTQAQHEIVPSEVAQPIQIQGHHHCVQFAAPALPVPAPTLLLPPYYQPQSSLVYWGRHRSHYPKKRGPSRLVLRMEPPDVLRSTAKQNGGVSDHPRPDQNSPPSAVVDALTAADDGSTTEENGKNNTITQETKILNNGTEEVISSLNDSNIVTSAPIPIKTLSPELLFGEMRDDDGASHSLKTACGDLASVHEHGRPSGNCVESYTEPEPTLRSSADRVRAILSERNLPNSNESADSAHSHSRSRTPPVRDLDAAPSESAPILSTDPSHYSHYYRLCTSEPGDTGSGPGSLTFASGDYEEIVVHEAESGSECGSEDVETLGHRYESENKALGFRRSSIPSNTVPLAVELLQAAGNKVTKSDVKECLTNTHVLHSFYGEGPRKPGDDVVRKAIVSGDSGVQSGEDSADEADIHIIDVDEMDRIEFTRETAPPTPSFQNKTTATKSYFRRRLVPEFLCWLILQSIQTLVLSLSTPQRRIGI